MKFLLAVLAVFCVMFAVCTAYAGDKPDPPQAPDQVRPDLPQAPDQCKPDQCKPDQCKPDQCKPDQCKPDLPRPPGCIQKPYVKKCCNPCCRPAVKCKPSIVYDDKCKRVYCCPGVGTVVIVKDCGWRLRAHKVMKTNRRACRERCG